MDLGAGLLEAALEGVFAGVFAGVMVGVLAFELGLFDVVLGGVTFPGVFTFEAGLGVFAFFAGLFEADLAGVLATGLFEAPLGDFAGFSGLFEGVLATLALAGGLFDGVLEVAAVFSGLCEALNSSDLLCLLEAGVLAGLLETDLTGSVLAFLVGVAGSGDVLGGEVVLALGDAR